jgi:hypothetical protein
MQFQNWCLERYNPHSLIWWHPLHYLLLGETTNTNFIVFGLTRPAFEPTIYRTRGEHDNYYTTDALKILDNISFCVGMKRLGGLCSNRKKIIRPCKFQKYIWRKLLLYFLRDHRACQGCFTIFLQITELFHFVLGIYKINLYTFETLWIHVY